MVTKLQSFEFCVNLQENTLLGNSFLVINQRSILVVMSSSIVYELGGRKFQAATEQERGSLPKLNVLCAVLNIKGDGSFAEEQFN